MEEKNMDRSWFRWPWKREPIPEARPMEEKKEQVMRTDLFDNEQNVIPYLRYADMHDFMSSREKEYEILANRFFHIGHRHGLAGLRMIESRKLVVTRLTLTYNRTKALATAEYARAQETRKFEEEKNHTLKNRHVRYELISEYIDDVLLTNPKAFSVTMGIVYLLFSLALLASDIPISLSILSGIFGELPQYLQTSNGSLIPQYTLTIWVLAIGMSLVAYFVKIFIDEFLLSRRISTQIDSADFVSDRRSDDLRYQKLQKIFGIIVLIVVIGWFTVLGCARFDFRALASERVDVPSTWYIQLAFILTSILVPVIGGVFAAIGHDKISRRSARMKFWQWRNEASTKYFSSIEVLSNAKKEETGWQMLKEWSEKHELLDQGIEMCVQAYQHGYQRGLVEKLQSGDLYDVASLVYRNEIKESIGYDK